MRYLGAIERATGRAERLIADLLEASAIENGALTLVAARDRRRRASSARPPPITSCSRRRAAARSRAHVPDEQIVVRADRDRVLQVLGNLIGNALKHAKGTPIEISVERRERDARDRRARSRPGHPADRAAARLRSLLERPHEEGRRRPRPRDRKGHRRSRTAARSKSSASPTKVRASSLPCGSSTFAAWTGMSTTTFESREGLPADAFTYRSFLERELATIFARSWQVVSGARRRSAPARRAGRGARLARADHASTIARCSSSAAGTTTRCARSPTRARTRGFRSCSARRAGRRSCAAQHGRRFDCAGRVRVAAGLRPAGPTFRARAIRSPRCRSRRGAGSRSSPRSGGGAARRPARARRRIARAAARDAASACPPRSATSPATGSSTRGTTSIVSHRVRPPRAGRPRRCDRSRQLHHRAPRSLRAPVGLRARSRRWLRSLLAARALRRSEAPRVRAVVVRVPEPRAQFLSVGPLGQRLPADRPLAPTRRASCGTSTRSIARSTPSAIALAERAGRRRRCRRARAGQPRACAPGFAPRTRSRPSRSAACTGFTELFRVR